MVQVPFLYSTQDTGVQYAGFESVLQYTRTFMSLKGEQHQSRTV